MCRGVEGKKRVSMVCADVSWALTLVQVERESNRDGGGKKPC